MPKDKLLVSDFQLNYWIYRNKMRCKFILIYRCSISSPASSIHEIDIMEAVSFEDKAPSPANPHSQIISVSHIAFVDYAGLWFDTLHSYYLLIVPKDRLLISDRQLFVDYFSGL